MISAKTPRAEAPVLAKTRSSLPFSKEKALELLRKMMEIRYFEEETIKSYQQKKIAGFLHTYIGQEAVGIGCMDHKKAEDAVVTSYRCHGLALALGISARECMAELFGKVTGCARGKGGSMHFFGKEQNFLGGHGIVGGQFGPGIGAAFKANYVGNGGVSFIFFGDGASVQGTLHESLNLAALWNLPALFICEDNQYGMGTANSRAVANTDIASKAVAYGIKGYTLNGMDLYEVHQKMGEIVSEVRETRRPVLIHMKTYRYFGHSVSDAGLYRSKDEVEQWRRLDPILALGQDAVKAGYLGEEDLKKMTREVKAAVQDAVEFADESPEPPLEELTRHVYQDPV